MKRISFKTLGCKVNQYETQGLREDFLKRGYREVEREADVYVINTCTVTAEADREARSLIRSCRRENPNAKIVVTGCYAQKDEKELLAIKGVTHLIKQHEKSRIAEILEEEASYDSDRPSYVSPPPEGKPRYLPLSISDFKDHTRAFIKVQDGCDYRCSFCKVWVVRGRSVSRDPSEIVAEAKRLTARGFREIVLTGVSLGLYGKDLEENVELMDLVGQLETIEDLKRIRLSSIDPIDVGETFTEKMFRTKKCCRHLHLSLQSGDDEILARMQRNYTSGYYRALVKRLRTRLPDFSITTDIIVGFPGETEEQFENTLNMVREVLFSRIHLFPYSPRKGTIAYRFKEELPSEVIRSRMKRLETASQEASFQYRRSLLGKEGTVLVESPEENQFLSGYTDRYVRVLFKGNETFIGRMVPVRIEEVTLHQTIGKTL